MTLAAPRTAAIDRRLVNAALTAATVADATDVQSLIAADLGSRHKRPVGDRPNNHGLMGASGSYDLKLIELVTNMQDGVLERLALRRHGGSDSVPYRTPHEAAEALLPDAHDLGEHPVQVVFRESDPPTARNKRLTAVFRDLGCGLTAGQLPTTVFQLGGSYKEDLLYLQGAFGMGGAMTYRNAAAVVVVSRRAPELLAPGEEDRITVAVVQWEKLTKGSSAHYLVDRPWTGPGDGSALPWSCPAAHVPDFAPGTHLALISYGVEGLHRKREGDERTFDTVVNTRLFRPVTPVRFTNEIADRGRSTTMRGLGRRLGDNPHRDRPEGEEILPFNLDGTTYQLPVRYWVFAAKGEAGERRSFAAADHVVLFLSHGQVHHHWTPTDFRTRTRLKRLHDRVLITVDTDELPIEVRTSLFTADRNTLVRNDPAIRLEEAVLGFIDDWDALGDVNSKLIRDALRGDTDKPTLDIARRIGRALSVRGYALGGGGGTAGSSGGAPGPGSAAGGRGGKPKPVQLHTDPTRIDGPTTIRAEIGKSRSVGFTIDVVDQFFTDRRGQITVECDHPAIGTKEIAVGQVRDGRFRITIAVPDGLDPAIEELRVNLTDWLKSTGGLGTPLTFATKLELVDVIPATGGGRGKPTGGGTGTDGAQTGGNVALMWTDHDEQHSWDRMTVGEVELTPADVLAAVRSEYADLAALGSTPIPVVKLNQEYPPLKNYLAGRSKTLVNLDRPREEYALGVGVDLLVLNEAVQARETAGQPVDEEFLATAQEAAARAVLAVMPAFDEMAKQAGLDGTDA